MEIVDERMASIPSADTVWEWAHLATKECLDSELEAITLKGSTIISSLTATSQTGTTNIRNELVKAKREITEGRDRALKGIDEGCEKAIAAVTNKIANTGGINSSQMLEKKPSRILQLKHLPL